MAPSLPSTTTTSTSITMPPPTPTLTLIVAATSRTMGIGLNGHLPWSQLKKEMAYFARVTKHAPPSPPSTSSPLPSTSSSTSPFKTTSPSTTATPTPHPTLNAVLMGRKTWESIPRRFRPLAGRINVVISRKPESLDLAASQTQSKRDGTPVFAARSIRDALDTLQATYGDSAERGCKLGHLFVIGGAEIYRVAMGMAETRRVLFTRVRMEAGREFECDTFFPVGLGVEGSGRGEADGGDGDGDEGGGWVKRGRKEMGEFVGAEGIVPEGVVTEGDVRWEVELWERGDGDEAG